MAGATTKRAHPRLVRFAIDSAAPATVAVLRTVPPTPLILNLDGTPPARSRPASGLPLDTSTLHATYGHAPHQSLRATCAAYSMLTPKAAAACVTCATSNKRNAPVYRSPRSPTQHTTESPWSGRLIGPACTQSRTGVVYGLHLTERNAHYE